MYIRMSRCNVPDIFDEHYHFNFKKAQILEEGSDISIFTNGETLPEVLVAAEELKKENISVEVINVPVVKSLDVETVVQSAKKTNFVITIENHSIIGGLGSAVCEALSEKYPTKVRRIGINDEFGQSGSSDALLEYYGLNAKGLAKRIKTLYSKR